MNAWCSISCVVITTGVPPAPPSAISLGVCAPEGGVPARAARFACEPERENVDVSDVNGRIAMWNRPCTFLLAVLCPCTNVSPLFGKPSPLLVDVDIDLRVVLVGLALAPPHRREARVVPRAELPERVPLDAEVLRELEYSPCVVLLVAPELGVHRVHLARGERRGEQRRARERGEEAHAVEQLPRPD